MTGWMVAAVMAGFFAVWVLVAFSVVAWLDEKWSEIDKEDDL